MVKIRSRKARIIRVLTFVVAMIGVITSIWLFHDLPSLQPLTTYQPRQSIRVTDRHGKPIYEFLPENTGRISAVPLDTVPVTLQQALIATEDHSFYQNNGVDLLGVLRAIVTNIRQQELVVGGSTITQQVVRNLVFTREERQQRTIRRKLREMYLAWRLNAILSKDEIFTLYLNNIYFGNLSYGVEAAALTYFGKSVQELSDAECALLAGLVQAPEYYNPFVNPDLAKERQIVVLDLMQKHNYISSWEKSSIADDMLVYESNPFPARALHFAFMVQSEVNQLISHIGLGGEQGLTVKTTLDLNWQQIAERAISQQLEALKNNPDGIDYNVNNMALIAIEPTGGAIRALVGSQDYFDQEHNGAINMVTVPRQPGSALKPFVYAAAFNPASSSPWTASSMILDVQTDFIMNDGVTYSPSNYDHREHGPVSARVALASSLNVPAIILLDNIGVESLVDLVTKLGVTTLDDPVGYDLSLALGGGSVSLLELTVAYAAFANQGYKVEPYYIQEIRDINDRLLYSHQPAQSIPVLDKRVAWLISDILSDDQSRVLGFGPNSTLNLDQPAAVKTGTTSNFHDNWTVGFTPELTVGVWVGNANQVPMWNVTGLTGAAPVWHQFMRQVLSSDDNKGFERPSGMVRIEVCTVSGLLPTDNCPYRRSEWFIEGTEPTEYDSIYQLVTIDNKTGYIASEETSEENLTSQLVFNLPQSAHNWARTQGYLLFSDFINPNQTTLDMLGTNELEALPYISSPSPLTTYRISDELPRGIQKVAVEISTQTNPDSLIVWIDGEEIAVLNEPPYVTWWPLEAGLHKIEAQATLNDGNIIELDPVIFEVLE